MSTELRPGQLVFHYASDDEGNDWWAAHRVLKVTPKRIYVDRTIELPDEDRDRPGGQPWPPDVHVLDRATFERDGCASTGMRTYYASPTNGDDDGPMEAA